MGDMKYNKRGKYSNRRGGGTADALDSGSNVHTDVGVQIPFSA